MNVPGSLPHEGGFEGMDLNHASRKIYLFELLFSFPSRLGMLYDYVLVKLVIGSNCNKI